MILMNNTLISEDGGSQFTIFLPNGTYVAKIVCPIDNRDNDDFDVVFNITSLIAARYNLIDSDINSIKRLKMPANMRVFKGNGEYAVTFEDLQVGHFIMPTDVVSAKVITGIAILLEKRWRIAVKSATVQCTINR